MAGAAGAASPAPDHAAGHTPGPAPGHTLGHTPRWHHRVLWAMGSLTTGSVSNAISLYALFFMTSVLGIGAALGGTMVLVAKLYGAIIDPLMGALSDATRTASGPRRPYLVPGAILIGVSFALFFRLPALSGWHGPALAMAVLLFYSTAYSLYAVPYLAMPPEIVSGYDARTGLMAYRVLFAIISVLIGSAGAPILIQHYGATGGGYAMLGIVLGAVAIAAGVITWAGTAAFPPPTMQPRAAAISWRALLARPFTDVAAVLGAGPFRILTLVKLLQLTVQGVALACTPYFFTYVLKMQPTAIAQYLAAFTVAGLVCLPLWRLVIRRFGKKQTDMVLLVSYGLAMLSWLAWAPGEPIVALYARAAWIGASSTGTLLCALALLPDTMEYDRLISGQKREGVMSGVAAFVEKLAGALGPFVIGILLQTMGLLSTRDPAAAQPANALLAVKLGMSVVPALLTFACLPILSRYNLDQAELERVRHRVPAPDQ